MHQAAPGTRAGPDLESTQKLVGQDWITNLWFRKLHFSHLITTFTIHFQPAPSDQNLQMQITSKKETQQQLYYNLNTHELEAKTVISQVVKLKIP